MATNISFSIIAITSTRVDIREGTITSGYKRYRLELVRWKMLVNGFRKVFLEKGEHYVSKAGDDSWCIVPDT